jgi:hypothetical protein
MTRNLVRGAASIAAVVAAVLATAFLGAQASRSYTWYAELVSVDRSAKTLTAKALVRDAVHSYVAGYKPGDKLMLTWVPVKGEADTVIYAPRYEVMKGIDEGYILPVEFVAADRENRTITFKTPIPDPLLESLASLRPGTWIKVTSPLQQPRETATLVAAAAAERPNLKPLPPPPLPAPEPARGRGRDRNLAAATVGLAGTWTISATLEGSPTTTDCTFVQEGGKLTGTCTSRLGESSLGGEMSDGQVAFQYRVNVNGADLEFSYAGTIEPNGNAMNGTVTALGVTSGFSAVRK